MKQDLTVNVDGTEYVLRCMKASFGSRILLQMGRLLLPSAKVFTIFDFKQKLLDMTDVPFEMEDLVRLAGQVLREDEMMTLIETVLAPCSANDGQRIFELKGSDYETHFSGKYETLYKVFFMALKHNYASFFLGLRAERLLEILKESRRKMQEKKAHATPDPASQTPPTPTPSSGGPS